jgi:threonine dehydratase
MAAAAWIVDPVFRATPQFVSEPLSADLGVRLVVKVETPNPVRCLSPSLTVFCAQSATISEFR